MTKTTEKKDLGKEYRLALGDLIERAHAQYKEKSDEEFKHHIIYLLFKPKRDIIELHKMVSH